MTENKKSGHPTQPGSHSNAPDPIVKKRSPILYRMVRFFKRLHWTQRTILVLDILSVCIILWWVLGSNSTAPQTQTPEEAQTDYIISATDTCPEDTQTVAAAEAGFEKRYALTDDEHWEVASVVTAEAEGEPFAGKVAVAQCILQACEDDGIRPGEAVVKYSYAKSRPEPTEEALEAVRAVFDFGQIATTDPIKYFYAPARCQSGWHESQVYVMTVNNHRFFKEAE